MKLLSMLKMRLVSAPVERKQILCRPLVNASIAPSQYCSSSSWGIVERAVGEGKLFLPNIGVVGKGGGGQKNNLIVVHPIID